MATKATPRVPGRVWSIELVVVGLRFRWKRSGRQALAGIIEKRGSITGIRLVREPDNPKHSGAIMVMLPERMMNGAQIGYLRRDAADLLAPVLDSGRTVQTYGALVELDKSEDWNVGTLALKFKDVKKASRSAKRK